MSKYPKEQLWKLYEGLPEKLKKAIFSEEIADDIYSICKKNKLKSNEKISQIAENIGYVFLGLVFPSEIREIFQKKIGIKKETAEKIYQEVSRVIFSPLKEILEKLYGVKIEASPGDKERKGRPEVSPSKKKKEKDIYREPTG